MSQRFRAATERAARHDGVITLRELEQLGVDRSLRSYWVLQGKLRRLGPRSFAIAGSPPSWHQQVRGAAADLDGRGAIAGRSAARLHALDGFSDVQGVELLVPRQHRGLRTPHTLRSTSFPFGAGDLVLVAGMRCLTSERLILDAPLFGFDREEIENSIDSSIRLGRVDEHRLRARVEARCGRRLRNHVGLVSALVDMGGESRLERRFLELLRIAELPRPELQRVFRDGSRFLARVDAFFDNDLIVELSGHATHSNRRQRQHDEQRRTELTLQGKRVITFTYDDVNDRPHWVVQMVAAALDLTRPA